MKPIEREASRRLSYILFSVKGIVGGALTLGVLALVVFVTLHYAQIPAGGSTTWIILGVLAIISIIRGIYITRSELHRLNNYGRMW